jgi:hypothetical protein
MLLNNIEIVGPDPQTGDYIIFGDICDPETKEIIGTFGDNGKSVSKWFSEQSVDFQNSYIIQFISIMAQQIAKKEIE